MSAPAILERVRGEARLHIAEARAKTDELFRCVRPEALYDRPIPERHRIIFYVGHLEAFDWNLLAPRAFGLTPFNQDFDHLFAFGIDPVKGRLPHDKPSDWPDRAMVKGYSQLGRDILDAAIERWSNTGSGHPNTAQLLQVAVEHRLMHAETLSYMLHQLPIDRKIAPSILTAPPAYPAKHHIKSKMAAIPAGRATLGLHRSQRSFGWDNEFEAHEIGVPEFAIDIHNVTNGDFLKFVDAGGYEQRALWSDEDWAWRQAKNVRHPAFWTSNENSWMYHTMFAEIPLPLDWPVYSSHAEASAYARWLGKSLPTEAQFHRAAYGTPQGLERDFPWSDESPRHQHGNFDFQSWDPMPVGSRPEGASAFGVEDLVGNGWEWTRTVFGPFDGFTPFPFYPGYSADFFDGRHYVLKGGSPRTAACMLRRSFRNWFQPHYPYAYTTFRCVEN